MGLVFFVNKILNKGVFSILKWSVLVMRILRWLRIIKYKIDNW